MKKERFALKIMQRRRGRIYLLVSVQDHIADFAVRRVGQFSKNVVMFHLAPWCGHHKTSTISIEFFGNFCVPTSTDFVRICVVNDGRFFTLKKIAFIKIFQVELLNIKDVLFALSNY